MTTLLRTKVAILGGGMSGVIAARTFSENKMTDYVIIEARSEFGGRMYNTPFGGFNVELGCNWVQGLGGNPIWATCDEN